MDIAQKETARLWPGRSTPSRGHGRAVEDSELKIRKGADTTLAGSNPAAPALGRSGSKPAPALYHGGGFDAIGVGSA